MNEKEKLEQRQAEKKRRMLEKAGRLPLNDVVLEVQKGVIDIKDLFNHIDMKLKETVNG